jgi:hypothetical protein
LFHIFEPPAPERAFEIEDLLVDVADFPPNWYVNAPPAPMPHYDGAITTQEEDIHLGFRAKSPTHIGAGQTIYRFGAQWLAAAEYSEQLPIWFNSNSVASLTPWETPEELPHRSPVADQFHFACHRTTLGPNLVCLAMGQYEEYLVVFNTHIAEDYMTFADLEGILLAIDERMALYLGEDME